MDAQLISCVTAKTNIFIGLENKFKNYSLKKFKNSKFNENYQSNCVFQLINFFVLF